MRYKDLIIKENDSEHKETLKRTGFWGNQGAGVLFVSKNARTVLLNHRSNKVEQPGTWGTWGGAIDNNEDPVEAAIREASEESGQTIDKSQMKRAYVFTDEKTGFKYYNFFVVFQKEFSPRIPKKHAWETQGWGWFGLDDLPSPLHFGAKALLSDSKSRKLLMNIFHG